MSDEELREHLNHETGKLEWNELAPHFARGSVICVNARLDLIEVAMYMIKDEKAKIEKWIEEGLVKRATDEDATEWTKRNSLFWAVVAAPWVIVQEVVEN